MTKLHKPTAASGRDSAALLTLGACPAVRGPAERAAVPGQADAAAVPVGGEGAAVPASAAPTARARTGTRGAATASRVLAALGRGTR